MNWPVWRIVEKVLLDLNVKPILAVVPDNQDETLKVEEENKNFWNEVRNWQARGWTIGLHGYQHVYTTQNSGLLGINQFSEFSGLPYEEQRRKLERGLDVFRREQVTANLWVAPGHSFDEITLVALRSVGIRHISDGLFPFPCADSSGVVWIPQQLWRFHYMPLGVWTICCHINRWTTRDIQKFRLDLQRFQQVITGFSEVLDAYSNRQKTRLDDFYAKLHLRALRSLQSGFPPLLRRVIWR